MKDANLYWLESTMPYTTLNSDEDQKVKIDFKEVSTLRNFINNGDRVFKTSSPGRLPGYVTKGGYLVYKVVKITKIKHTAVEAVVRKYTLREYNLDTLLEF